MQNLYAVYLHRFIYLSSGVFLYPGNFKTGGVIITGITKSFRLLPASPIQMIRRKLFLLKPARASSSINLISARSLNHAYSCYNIWLNSSLSSSGPVILKYRHPFFQKGRKTGASSITLKPAFFNSMNASSISDTSKAM